MKESVAIIGGGWAGLAAAVELVRAGKTVTVYESGKVLGGRARRLAVDDSNLDNGLHLLIGAYGETLRLMELVAPDSARNGFLRLPLTLDYPDGVRIRAPRLPAPFHLAGALLMARGLSLADKIAALRFMRELQRLRYDPPDVTVAKAISDQPQAMRRYLWEPLCVAALNTPTDQASFRVFARVLKDALTGAASNCDFLIPSRDLSSLFPEAAATWLRQRGSEVIVRRRIHSLSRQEPGWKLAHDSGEAMHDQVIVATAPFHVPPLIAALPGSEAAIRSLSRLQYQPIVTVYAVLPGRAPFRTPLLGWVDPVPLFMFDMQTSHKLPGTVAAVASADGPHLQWDDARWQQEIHSRLESVMGSLPQPEIIRRVTERRATLACTPDTPRLPHATPWPGIYLAGDHTEGPYPSTLEGAVRSGVQCAQTLLATS